MGRLRSRASFSLVELTIIVGIIAILLALIFPTTNLIIERSQRAKAARNLRTIALAHAHFINDFGRAIHFSDLSAMKGGSGGPYDVNLLAAVLAKYGYIKDVSVWAWDFDYLVKNYKQSQGSLPTRIYNADNSRIDPTFAGQRSGGNFPLSVACCVVQSPNFDYSQLLNSKIPCACSRGLYSNGRWWKKSDGNIGGVWSDKGGLIAFFDGHVEWFDNISGRFKKYNSTTATTNLCEIFPNYHVGNWADSCFLNWQGNGSYGSLHN
ncbi:MAG: type II secretion system GspH family protein [Puniceicoccales bacterium]|nr:type II secretion system GspH family protein [Puniceicoccales bacterium]